MADNKSLDRAVASGTTRTPIGEPSKVIDFVTTEWTDEMHRLYLNSIEASFVNQLYSSEYRSNDMPGYFAKAQLRTNSSRSDLKNQSFGQFKVMRRGCWEKSEPEEENDQYENQNEAHRISGNSWIQRFTGHSTAKASNQRDESDFVGQSIHVKNLKHGLEPTSSKRTPAYRSHKVHKVSVGSVTEVSDQNFVDMEAERGEELDRNRNCGKKRARSAMHLITDQVVPFVTPASEVAPILKENDEEMNVQHRAESLQNEHESLPIKNQESNDPKLEGG